MRWRRGDGAVARGRRARGSWAALVALGLCAWAPHSASAATAHVSYCAGGSVYVDAGKLEGLRVGDTLDVVRDPGRIARLRVVYLSSHRASCDTFSVATPPRVGDLVRFVARVPAAPQAASTAPVSAADSSASAADTSTAARSPGLRASRATARGTRSIRGRIGVGYFGASGGSSDLVQPSLDARLDGANLGGAPIDVAVDVRGRRTTWTGADGIRATDARARVYRMSVAAHSDGDRYRVALGRQAPPGLASISLFDGALVETNRGRFHMGLFSGAEPEPGQLRLSGDIIDHGAFAGVGSLPLAPRRWRINAGGVTSYDHGQPNRDFLFAQGWLQDRGLSFSASQEVDYNRYWKRALGEPRLSPTNTFVVARLQVVEPFTVRAGFDNRRNVRLYRDRTTPETEFDDRYRSGAWGGAALDLGRHLRLDGEARGRGGSALERSHTWSGTIEARQFAALNAVVRGRYSNYASDITTSDLMSLALGLDPLAGAHLELTGGSRRTTDEVSHADERVGWEAVDLDLGLALRWYLSGSYERDHGGLEDVTQGSASLSWRF